MTRLPDLYVADDEDGNYRITIKKEGLGYSVLVERRMRNIWSWMEFGCTLTRAGAERWANRRIAVDVARQEEEAEVSYA